MNERISIIVPVYNCAPYLAECINSLLSERDLYDIEILLIDDGSTDGSEKICNDYSSAYSEVQTIHTPNQGVSCARNKGIEEATGDWIMFVDADDVLKPDTLSRLDKHAQFQHYEMTRFGAYRLFNGKELPYPKKYSKNINEFRNLVMARDAFLGVCSGIYEKKLFTQHSIRFTKGIRTGEDWIVLFMLLCHTQKFQYYNENLYGYRANPNSVILKKSHSVKPDTMIAFSIILNYIKEQGITIPLYSIYRAKSVLRCNAMKNAIINNSKYYYRETDRLITQYVPQSIWRDIRYCKKLKHIVLPFIYKILYLWKLYISDISFFHNSNH